ncbi:hypothetical protein ACHMW6_00225 (plasmid) [Pseudoduganella sp. UC29_106]|uniref:hypothetical protein n=1 Tax=Pseudoduganella sp. UC29_106 TaxID=3374553 RepID=UPI0037576E0F
MINATTTANFALFNRKAKDTDEEGKEYPLMTGAISTDDWEVSVFAYKRVSKQGRTFLSLTIRNDGDEQTFTGMLFKDEKKTDAYYGFIEEQFLDVVDGAMFIRRATGSCPFVRKSLSRKIQTLK